MRERTTKADLDRRVANVNRRLENFGSPIRYAAASRYGYTALDRYRTNGNFAGDPIICGTKREVAEALWAIMRALDDAAEGEERAAVRGDS